MSTTSALGYVYDSVKAALVDDGTSVTFGRREAAKQTNQGTLTGNRVVIEPAVGLTAGKFGPPKFPGRNPKPLGTFLASATVYVWAYDPNGANDERAQYEAVTLLLGKVYAAIRACLHRKAVESRAVHGFFEVSEASWTSDRVERVKGAEVSFTLAVTEDIFDLPVGVAANVTGEVTYDLTSAAGA